MTVWSSAPTRTMALISFTYTRDSDGNKVRGAEAAAAVTGLYAPGASSEATNGQDQVVTQPALYLEPGQPVPAAIDVAVPDPALTTDGDGNTVLDLDGDGKVQGDRYEVDGDPEVWSRGTVVRLKRVSG